MLSKRGRRSSLSSEGLTSSSWTSRLSSFPQPAVIPTRVDNKPSEDSYWNNRMAKAFLQPHRLGLLPTDHLLCSIPKKSTVGTPVWCTGCTVPTLSAKLYYQTWTVFSVLPSELYWIGTIQCIKLLREYRYRSLCFGSGLDPESTSSVDPVQEPINDPQKR
jgi:hypothetical protein